MKISKLARKIRFDADVDTLIFRAFITVGMIREMIEDDESFEALIDGLSEKVASKLSKYRCDSIDGESQDKLAHFINLLADKINEQPELNDHVILLSDMMHATLDEIEIEEEFHE